MNNMRYGTARNYWEIDLEKVIFELPDNCERIGWQKRSRTDGHPARKLSGTGTRRRTRRVRARRLPGRGWCTIGGTTKSSFRHRDLKPATIWPFRSCWRLPSTRAVARSMYASHVSPRFCGSDQCRKSQGPRGRRAMWSACRHASRSRSQDHARAAAPRWPLPVLPDLGLAVRFDRDVGVRWWCAFGNRCSRSSSRMRAVRAGKCRADVHEQPALGHVPVHFHFRFRVVVRVTTPAMSSRSRTRCRIQRIGTPACDAQDCRVTGAHPDIKSLNADNVDAS